MKTKVYNLIVRATIEPHEKDQDLCWLVLYQGPQRKPFRIEVHQQQLDDMLELFSHHTGLVL